MSGLTRRGLLGVGVAGALAGRASAPSRAPATGGNANPSERIAFDGAHQAGILTPRPAYGLWIAFDVLGRDPAALADALRACTAVGRALTAGSGDADAPRGDADDPPGVRDAAGGARGAGAAGAGTFPPDALTVTLGLGASLFAPGRFGLEGRRPAGLAVMRRFPGDALQGASSDGDVLVQLCAQSPEAVQRALRALTRATRGTLVPRWSVAGFHPASQRNPLGFVDGIVNPVGAQRDRVVWTPDGGTHLVVRRIRTHVEAWDRTPRSDQEATIGRRKDDGAFLASVPADAHVRRARPAGAPITMLRRPYVYADGLDPSGELDVGLVFCAFQADVAQGFDATAARLAGEPLAAVTTATGGGAFFLPPGARGPGDWVGRTLVAR